MLGNTPIPDAELAELRRLHGEAQKTTWQAGAAREIYAAFPGLLARLEAAERERDELAGIVKSPEYRQMLADQANLPDRDAQQRREGAAEVIDGCRVALEKLDDLAYDWANAASSATHPQSGPIESRIEREARQEFEATRTNALALCASWKEANGGTNT